MYANLEGVEEVFSVGLNRAVALLAEKASGAKSRFQRAKPTVLKDLGEHPAGGKIEVLSGRYGPYVKHDKINATVPNGRDPATLTLDEAVELIAARAAKGGKKPARKAKAAPKAKKSAKETATKNGAKIKDGKTKEPAKAKGAAKPRKAKPQAVEA
jgi:DNA topoisomerase I